jgi:hypothetical protein
VADGSSDGIVYVLTNSAMPGLTKIGKTNQEDIQTRMSQLYTTGVPVQFDCVFACQVKDCGVVESALHNAFGNTRVNPKREFFQIEPERVVSILKLLAIEDVTPEVEKELSEGLDAADKESRDALTRSRRPPLNFEAMKIPVGAILTYRDDNQVQVKVVDARHVEYNGVPCSLTKAHREIFKLDYTVQPTPYWTYNGRSLKDIYDETYDTIGEE